MKTALAIVVAIIVIAGVYFLFAKKTQAPVTNPETTSGTAASLEMTNPTATTTTTTTVTPSGAASAAKTVTVTYTGNSFSPASITIKKGDSVKFVDATGAGIWVASNPHPIHNGYSGTTVDQHCPDTTGTAFDQCSPGTSYTFTFQKVGSWGYHNHLNHGAMGTVVVQ
jgi:plastocyanin